MNPENINQIIEQIKPAMSKMAEQLGVSMEFLWEVLLKQQYVDGFLAVGYVIIGIIAIPFLVKLWKKCIKEMNEDSMSDYIFVLGFACIPLTLVVVFVICFNFFSFIYFFHIYTRLSQALYLWVSKQQPNA